MQSFKCMIVVKILTHTDIVIKYYCKQTTWTVLSVFLLLVREKKDLPLDPVDQKDQDGSFDYQ